MCFETILPFTKSRFMLSMPLVICIRKVVFNKLPNAEEMAKLLREGSQQIEDLEATDKVKHQLYKKLYERFQKGRCTNYARIHVED